MAELTVRVELHGVEWEDYDALRVEMLEEGFAAIIAGSGGAAYELPAEPACAERGALVTKSAVAGNLDAVQAQLTRFLKPLGYHKRGRSFNHDTGEGVPQVINPQMAGCPDPDDQES